MADIKNDTLNFGYGRVPRTLDLAEAKSASAEIERGRLASTRMVYG